MLRETVFVIGVLIAATSADDAAAVNIAAVVSCSSTASVVSGMQKCLDLYSVPLTLPTADQLENVSASLGAILQQLNKNTTIILCRDENRENYIKATLCILNISKKCVAGSNPAIDALLSSPETIRKQINLQCQTLTEFNQECILANLESLQECVDISGVLNDTSVHDPDYLTRIHCLTADISLICARKHLASCGQATLQIYEQQLPDLAKVCSNYTGLNSNGSNGTSTDCNNFDSVRKSYLSCQVKAGIFILLPESLDSNSKVGEYVLKTLTLEHNQNMCRKIQDYQEFVNCTLSVQRQCSVSDNLKERVPDTDSVQTGFRQLCMNITDFNSSCITNLTDLDETNKTEPRPIPVVQTNCDEIIEKNKKKVDLARSCGEVTVTLYKNVLSSQLPTSCRSTHTTIPDKSAGDTPSVSAFLLILTTVVLRLFMI